MPALATFRPEQQATSSNAVSGAEDSKSAKSHQSNSSTVASISTTDSGSVIARRIAKRIHGKIMESMSTPGERLQKHLTVFRNTPGNEDAFRPTVAAANVDCAIEITEALIGLTVAVQSMEKNSVIVMNNLIKKIDEATVQAAESAKESGKVATESANLSRKLNRLTIWVIIAAFLSAVAAVVQAGVAVAALIHSH